MRLRDNCNKGFTVLELLMAIVIMGILMGIGAYSWQQYVLNSNLRTAARSIAADMAMSKQNARLERRLYTMTFNAAANNYTITAPAVTDPAVMAAVNMIKSPSAHGSDITISLTSPPNFSGGNVIFFLQRGMIMNWGTVTLRNSRASTAVITVNSAGRTYVTFTML